MFACVFVFNALVEKMVNMRMMAIIVRVLRFRVVGEGIVGWLCFLTFIVLL